MAAAGVSASYALGRKRLMWNFLAPYLTALAIVAAEVVFVLSFALGFPAVILAALLAVAAPAVA
ncbi:MAG: hypothetical protein TU35_008655 [Thermoproteus sp. AZ2]|uniref:Uncharacterized protein n=1 Tax=Thermoproteus sp. AZ2 TaxID=1609232 RepID=A0ACC6V3F8_9CREN